MLEAIKVADLEIQNLVNNFNAPAKKPQADANANMKLCEFVCTAFSWCIGIGVSSVAIVFWQVFPICEQPLPLYCGIFGIVFFVLNCMRIIVYFKCNGSEKYVLPVIVILFSSATTMWATIMLSKMNYNNYICTAHVYDFVFTMVVFGWLTVCCLPTVLFCYCLKECYSRLAKQNE